MASQSQCLVRNKMARATIPRSSLERRMCPAAALAVSFALKGPGAATRERALRIHLAPVLALDIA